MTKKPFHNPHDKLFRASMQYPEVRREFLEMHLPPTLFKQIDPTSIDVSRIPEEALISHKWSRTLEFIMRNRFKQHRHHEIQKIAGNLNDLLHANDRQLVLELLSYVVHTAEDDCNFQELTHVIHELAPDVREEIMSLADRLRKEGELRGELRGKLEIARTMLTEGVESVFVAKYTGLSLSQVKALQDEL